ERVVEDERRAIRRELVLRGGRERFVGLARETLAARAEVEIESGLPLFLRAPVLHVGDVDRETRLPQLGAPLDRDFQRELPRRRGIGVDGLEQRRARLERRLPARRIAAGIQLLLEHVRRLSHAYVGQEPG